MCDADGPLIAKLFYEKLFENKMIGLDDVPRALDSAVMELRNRGARLESWATFIHVGA
jgi:hypothetical protein